MKKRFLFLLGIMIILSLLFLVRPAHAQDCLDAAGAPIPCPEKERKSTKTSPPPTATFTPAPTLTLTSTTTPTATLTPTNTSTFTPTATSVAFFAFLPPSGGDEGRTSPWGIWGIGAGLAGLAGLGFYSWLRPKSHAKPGRGEPKSYYEEELSARGSIEPEPKEFPEVGDELVFDSDTPIQKKKGVRSFFVDETGILLPPPPPEGGSDNDDDPPMPEI